MSVIGIPIKVTTTNIDGSIETKIYKSAKAVSRDYPLTPPTIIKLIHGEPAPRLKSITDHIKFELAAADQIPPLPPKPKKIIEKKQYTIFCEACDETYAGNSLSVHNESNKHKKMIEKSGKYCDICQIYYHMMFEDKHMTSAQHRINSIKSETK
jgi:hypothetical protein